MSSNECFKCGRIGHWAHEYPSAGGHGQMRGQGRGSFFTARDICYHCGKSGHLAKDCDLQEHACYNCGKGGNIAKDCKEPKKEREQCSYNCGRPGHLACDCEHADEQKCYSCGESGHILKDVREIGVKCMTITPIPLHNALALDGSSGWKTFYYAPSYPCRFTVFMLSNYPPRSF